MGKRIRVVAVLFVAMIVGGVLLDAFNVPTHVQETVIPYLTHVYLLVFPRRATARDVIRDVEGSSAFASTPERQLLRDQPGFWAHYASLRLDGGRLDRAFPSTAEEATVAHQLEASCPQVARSVVSLADLYAADRFPVFDGDTMLLGRDMTWTTYPPKNSDWNYIWELSTLQEMPILGEAYRLTGNSRYVEAIIRQLRSWAAQNPTDNSVNWKVAMEPAIRLVSLLWTEVLVGDAPAFRREFPQWSEIVYSHARFVANTIDAPRRPNNHDIFAAAGLYLAAVAHPEWKESKRWAALAEWHLQGDDTLEYTPEGAQREFAPTYQKALLDAWLGVVVAQRRLGRTIAPSMETSLLRQAAFLTVETGPDGRVAHFGDSDDHHFVRLDPSRYDDAGPTLYLAWQVLGGEPPAHKGCASRWKAAWITGTVDRKPAVPLTADPPPSAVAEPGAGFFKISSNDLTVVGKFSMLGANPIFEGHSHADASTFLLWHDRQPVVVAAGTYTYRTNLVSLGLHWRDYFRSSQAQNVTTVDGHSQTNPAGDFGFTTWPVSRLVSCTRSPGRWTAVTGVVDAYRALVGNAYRTFLLKDSSLTVVDWYPDAHGGHVYDSRLLFEDSALVQTDGRFDGQGGIRVFWARADSTGTQQFSGSPDGGWRSDDYGTKVPSAQLSHTVRSTGPAALAFSIVAEPRRGPARDSVAITSVSDSVLRLQMGGTHGATALITRAAGSGAIHVRVGRGTAAGLRDGQRETACPAEAAGRPS